MDRDECFACEQVVQRLDIPLVSDMISAGEIRQCTRDLLPPQTASINLAYANLLLSLSLI